MLEEVSKVEDLRSQFASLEQSIISVLFECRRLPPSYILANEKSTCLTKSVYLPTIVSTQVI